MSFLETFKPREHQAKLTEELKIIKAPLTTIYLVTGAGKSALFFYYAMQKENLNKKFLFVVPQIALAYQMSKYPVEVGILQGSVERDLDRRIIVTTIETYLLREKNEKWSKLDHLNFDEIWIDEAHTAVPRINKLLELKQDNQKFRFLSGTPFDGNKVWFPHLNHTVLGRSFDYDYMLNNKYLVPMVIYEEGDLNTKGMHRTSTGDYNQNEMSEAIEESDIDVVGTVLKRYDSRYPTAIVCQSIKHAKQLMKEFQAHNKNFRCEAVYTGATVDIGAKKPLKGKKATEYVLNMMRNFEVDFVFSVRMLTTGIDVPNLVNVVLATRLGQLSTFVQCGGRSARTYEGEGLLKTHSILIDLFGNVKEHGHPYERVDILDKKPVKKKKTSITCKTCGSVTPLLLVDKYQEDNDIITIKKCRDCGEEDISIEALPVHHCTCCGIDYKEIISRDGQNIITTCPECQQVDLLGTVSIRELVVTDNMSRQRALTTIRQIASNRMDIDTFFDFMPKLTAFEEYANNKSIAFIIDALINKNIESFPLVISRMGAYNKKVSPQQKKLKQLLNDDEYQYAITLDIFNQNPNRLIKRIIQYTQTPKKESILQMLKKYDKFLKK